MALFGTNYSVEPEDKKVLEMMEDAYRYSSSENQGFVEAANIDSRFEACDPTVAYDVYNVPFNRRSIFTFPKIRRNVNLTKGFQIQNRKSVICIPKENSDDVTASQLNEILLWLFEREDIGGTVSDSFGGALIAGLSLMQISLDYNEDPVSGDIKVEYCPYNSFFIDPFWKKHDLSDCNYIWKRSLLTPFECSMLLPDSEDEIMELKTSGSSYDGKFPYLPECNGLPDEKLLTYDEFYYKSFRKATFLIDSRNNETSEYIYSDKILESFLKEHPELIVHEKNVATVKLAIVVQGKVFYNGENPLGIDNFPFVPVTAYFNPSLQTMSQRFQSIVRGLRDSQYLFNRMRNLQLEMQESVGTTGLIYKEGALVDEAQAHQTGQGLSIKLDAEASMTDVQQIAPIQIPPSTFELSKMLSDDIMEGGGFNDSNFGETAGDSSGYQTMVKMTAGKVALEELFDKLDKSQRILGRLLIKIIQKNFSTGKVNTIIEDEPSKEFYDERFGKYDIAIEDGFNTSTQRQMQFAQLLKLREAGVPVPEASLIRASNVQNKEDLIKDIEEQKQQAAEMAQKQQEAAIKELDMRSELAHSHALSYRASGLERVSRISENMTIADVHKSEAAENRTDAALNMIKAAKEIQGIDLNQLEQLISMANTVKESEAQKSEIMADQTEEAEVYKATALKNDLINPQSQMMGQQGNQQSQMMGQQGNQQSQMMEQQGNQQSQLMGQQGNQLSQMMGQDSQL